MPPQSSEHYNHSTPLLLYEVFFLPPSSGDGKLAPVSHSCSWVLMPLKVWHRAVIWDMSPSSGCGCLPTGFPRGNGNHSSIYCFVFAAFPHAPQIPHNWRRLWRMGGGYHESILISLFFQVIQCAIWNNKCHKDSRHAGTKFSCSFSRWENGSGIKIKLRYLMIWKVVSVPKVKCKSLD